MKLTVRRRCLALLAGLVGGPLGVLACDRAPHRGADAGVAATARLIVTEARHDFGNVVQGDVLHHRFAVANAGAVPLTLEPIAPAPSCSAILAPEIVPPGGSADLEVTCRVESPFPRLRDTLVLHPKHAGAGEPIAVELAASVTPILALDTDLLAFSLPFGEERTQDVRLIGARAADARLAIRDAGDAGLAVEPLPSAVGVPSGLRVHVRGNKVGVHVGNLVLATGLPRPAELVIPYSCKVTGTLDVSPTNPYFNLHEPGPKVQFIDVQSSQPGFAVRAADVTEGPFVATVERGSAGSPTRVKVTVREDRLDDETRGAIGKVIIRSNDRTEPAKEIPLFAMGSLNRTQPVAPAP